MDIRYIGSNLGSGRGATSPQSEDRYYCRYRPPARRLRVRGWLAVATGIGWLALSLFGRL